MSKVDMIPNPPMPGLPGESLFDKAKNAVNEAVDAVKDKIEDVLDDRT